MRGRGRWAESCKSVCNAVAFTEMLRIAERPPHPTLSPRAGRGTFYLIACGLIGEPVPPLMTSGGPQKKNS